MFLARPGEVQRGAEGLVAQGERGVDDVLAVAADGDEAAIGRVEEGLRIDFCTAKVFGRKSDGLAVLQCLVVAFDDGGQDLRMPRPDDLAGAVHGDGGFLPAHLHHHGSIVESHGNPLPAPLIAHAPRPL